jgi:type II secretory pathway pseudopilin PulG
MKKIIIFKDRNGFSLVESIISIGIASLVSLSITYAVVSSLDGLSHQRNFNLTEETVSIISGMMGDPNYCTLHFNGKVISPTLPATVVNDIELFDMASDSTIGSSQLFAVGRTIQNTLAITDFKMIMENSIGPNRYIGYLSITFKANTGYNAYFTRKIALNVSTDSSSKIASCSRSLQPSIGPSQGVFSENCTDFAAKGWASKDQCLQDGRWHIVYSNDASGNSSFGSTNDIDANVQKGASLKVSIKPGFAGWDASYYSCIEYGRYTGANNPTHAGLCIIGPSTGSEPLGAGYYNLETKISPLVGKTFLTTGVVFLQSTYNTASDPLGTKIPMDWWIRY